MVCSTFTLALCLIIAVGISLATSHQGNALEGDSGEFEPRIVGGMVVRPRPIPPLLCLKQIGIGYPRCICGATILSSEWALTAARCFDDIPDDVDLWNFSLPYSLIAGEVDLLKHERWEQETRISRIIKHENYSKYDASGRNDIAVVKMSPPLQFHDQVYPINLPTSALLDPPQSSTLVVTGWGLRDTTTGAYSTVLKTAGMKFLRIIECKIAYLSHNLKITYYNHLCAVPLQPSSAPCSGDTGGPLFYTKDKNEPYQQVGIISFTPNSVCAAPHKPLVTTNVFKYLPWIRNHTYV